MNLDCAIRCKPLGRTSDEGGEAGGRDRNPIVAHTGYVSPHAFAARPGRPRIGVNAQFSGIAPESAPGMNDEQVQHVDRVCTDLVSGGGSRAQQVSSAALVIVGAKAWRCR
jgi:hypothetical protein